MSYLLQAHGGTSTISLHSSVLLPRISSVITGSFPASFFTDIELEPDRETARERAGSAKDTSDIPRSVKSVFLAGTTSKVDTCDWRETLSASLSDVPVTIYNPYRADWDSSWCEEIDFPPFREQVARELDKQDKADIVVVYFHPAAQAPVSLLELRICARVPGKVIVACPEGYWKRGNVQIVCEKFGVEMVDNIEALREAIVKRLPVGS